MEQYTCRNQGDTGGACGGVVQEDRFLRNKTVSGVDISMKGGVARVACVVMSFPGLEPLECSVSSSSESFPYVPGLLSFRKIPALVLALEKRRVDPELLLVDEKNLAHLSRFGLVSHLGVLYNKPSLVCAKSRLIGTFS